MLGCIEAQHCHTASIQHSGEISALRKYNRVRNAKVKPLLCIDILLSTHIVPPVLSGKFCSKVHRLLTRYPISYIALSRDRFLPFS